MEGEIPSLSRLNKATHQHGDGQFVDHRSEQNQNDVEAQIQEDQTQLLKQTPDGTLVQLSMQEHDKLFEEVILNHF